MKEHYIEKCKICKTIIAQCRCPDKNKLIRWGICSNCAKLTIAELLEKNDDEDSV